MITKEMKEFMETVEMDEEYHWYLREYHNKPVPSLPSMENVVSVIAYSGDMGNDNPEHIVLSDGTICTKDEYEANYQYMNCKDVFLELTVNDNDEDSEDDFEEVIIPEAYSEGVILQPDYVSTDDIIDICNPGTLKFNLREFNVSQGIRLDKPILVFANDGGGYGNPEVDRIMVDDNCYVKMEGSISFKLYVFLRKFPENGKVNIITQLSTCLDS